MPNTTERTQAANSQKMKITVQGRRVVLCFAEKPNPEVAARVKQALLGTYMLTAK